ncbi:ubiquitin-specific protease ubp2 [Podila epigama]|nr:ubiquitin-specific protease ubp2 [Podila epigama]
MDDTLNVLIKVFNNVLNLKSSPLNSESKTFINSIGLDEGIKELFRIANFEFKQDGRFYPPETTPDNMDTLRTIVFQMQLVQSRSNPAVISDAKLELYNTSSLTHLGDVGYSTFRGQERLDFTNRAILPDERHSPAGRLGCLSDMSDDIIIEAFRTQVLHDPSSAHTLVDDLEALRKDRKTDALDLEIVCQRSEGIVSTSELNDAYKSFDIPDAGKATDDETLATILRASSFSTPAAKENLKIILKHKNNQELDKEFVTVANFANESMPEEDVSMSLYYSQNPVGLSNIGNTCYLNSLLQYIYTIKDIREAVLNMEAYTEDETDPDWKERVIDGRTLTKEDVSEAKEIVSELRNLFLQMRSAKRQAVTPSHRLVKLLLSNGSNNTTSSAPGVTASQSENDGFDQQDVTETMSILMNRLSAAFRPLRGTPDSIPTDRFKSLFYVKAHQTRHEVNESSGLEEERQIACDFNTLILPVTKDAFMEDLVDDYFNAVPGTPSAPSTPIISSRRRDKEESTPSQEDGTTSTTAGSHNASTGKNHAVTLSELPPILQVHLSRTAFDKENHVARKSDARVIIPKRLFLDEYKDFSKVDDGQENEQETEKHRRQGAVKRIKVWREERRECQKVLASLETVTTSIERNVEGDGSDKETSGTEGVVDQDLLEGIESQRSIIQELSEQITKECRSLHFAEYRIHAVFHHQGVANFGHYWVYIHDGLLGSEPRWINYSDGIVTEVRPDQEDHVFNGPEGSTAIFCVYVRDADANNFVQTVHRSIS